MVDQDQEGKVVHIRADDQAQKKQLLKQFISHDWQDLLRLIGYYVEKFGLATGSDIADQAQEILQDTILTAMRKPQDYNPGQSPRPWLLTIAVNHIRNAKRKKKRDRLVNLATDTPEANQLKKGLDDQQLADDDLLSILYKDHPESETIKINEILSLVDEADQEILRLRFIDAFPGKDIAEALGIKESAVYMRLFRALARLRTAYFEQEND